MKKILVLLAGRLQTAVIQRASEMGLYVIAVDGSRHVSGLKYADKAVIDDVTSLPRMIELARAEHIDGIIHPCSEKAMMTMAHIVEELHLTGLNTEMVCRATNKHLMRQAFEQHGAPSPKSFVADSAEQAWEAFCQIDGRAIIKPTASCGSRGVALIAADASRDKVYRQFLYSSSFGNEPSAVIEQYIKGPEFSVEMIVFKGKINVITVTDKITTGAPHFIELGHTQPSRYSEFITEAVTRAAIDGVKALGIDNCAAHAEVKVQNGMPYIMEIGARLGGDFISTKLTRLSTGVDMVAAAISIAMGDVPDLTPHSAPRGAAIRYFTPEAGVIQSIDYDKRIINTPFVQEFDIYKTQGHSIHPLLSSMDRAGHVITVGKDAYEAASNADGIQAHVYIKTRPRITTVCARYFAELYKNIRQSFA